jgi:hypothetical protein
MDGLEKPNFGIENTVDVDLGAAGSQDLLNDLMSPETSTASPDDVSSINKDDDNKGDDNKLSDEDKAALAKKAKEDENVDDDTASSPDALTDFLLKDEEDDEKDKDDDVDDDAAGQTSEDDKETDTDTSVEDNSDETDENKDEGTIAFDALATELFNLGVFNKIEDEDVKIESPEDFLERFKLEQQRGANMMIQNFIGQFGEEHQEAFQAIYVNGADPREYFTQQAAVQDFKGMDLSNEKNQEAVIRATLQNQGYESEDIDSEIERLKSYGDLEDVSKKHHKVLVKREEKQLKQQTLNAQQEQESKRAVKEEYIDNVRKVLTEKIKAKEFDGIPVNVQTANELQDFLLVDKWKTESGETLTDFDKTILELKRPENHATKVKVALLLKLIEKDPTLSTIQKSAVSKKSSELFKEVARQKTTAKRAVSNKRKPAQSWFQK